MPQVEISQDVFEALQARAAPLLDTVDSVLRRLLALTPSSVRDISKDDDEVVRIPSLVSSKAQVGSKQKGKGRAKRPRAARGSIVSEAEYEMPILQALAELGGKAPSSEVVDLVGKKLDGAFQPADREVLTSGDVRWKNRVQFVRLKLINAGDMKKGSPRGIWEISDQGRQRASGAV